MSDHATNILQSVLEIGTKFATWGQIRGTDCINSHGFGWGLLRQLFQLKGTGILIVVEDKK